MLQWGSLKHELWPKKKPQKTKNLDFISEHRNLQITKLFCPSVLDCALKTPKAKHLFCSTKTKQRRTRQSWKSFFYCVQPTEVADTDREEQALLSSLNTHTCYYRVHPHKHAASPLPPLLPLPPSLLVSLPPWPFLPSFSFSSVNEISVHTLLRNLSNLIWTSL